ncbi:MAG: hypothetical protein IJD79_03910 [Clostridia bacterium]|nr:hypothetical protein [Clostridia bacterium]
MLANTLNTMSAEEILGIFKPFLYLLGPVFAIIVISLAVKLWKKTGNARLFSFMDSPAHTEDEKREYLANYFVAGMGSVGDLASKKRHCALCNKKYSMETASYNSRGDIVKRVTNDPCPNCNFKLSYGTKDGGSCGFTLTRRPTTSPAEEKYNRAFERLSYYNDYYKPVMPETSDSGDDGNVTVTITFR